MEYPEFFIEKNPVARKQHKCCECHRIIKKGDKYQCVTGLWAGVVSTFKTWKKCTEIREYIRSEFGVDEVNFGGLFDIIGDYDLFFQLDRLHREHINNTGLFNEESK